jgi:prepilin-type processing-associated H-X9-DG protein
VLTSARRASTNTKCLNNLREIGMAMSQYLSDNEDAIPAAVSSNTWDDPASPNGAALRPKPYQPPDYFDWTPGALPVAYYLDPYLKYDLRPWHCPGTKVVHYEPDRIFRDREVLESDRVHVKDANGMWTGATGQWRPGYMFMSTLGWEEWYKRYDYPTWVKYGMSEWVVRNVAGLRVSEIKTMTLQPSSEVVLFYDYSSAYHSKSSDDVYELNQPGGNFANAAVSAAIVRGKFQSNFLFLDGHADTRRYTWQGGLLNAVHRPIPRGNYRESPHADSFTRVFPD